MEEIAYRPQNVRETLVELKNTSELAVDLAYAATLYGHEGLADAVFELEQRANSLQYPAKIALMLAAKRAEEAERLVGLVQIVEAAGAITNAAADVAAVEANEIGLPAAVRAALPAADEVIMRATVAEGSDLAGRTLDDLQLETETGVRIAAIRRADGWLIAPGPEAAIHAGDVVIGIGPADGVAAVYERATGEPQPREAPAPSDIEEVTRAAESVIDLKNIAELAVGLSYGAVLYDDAALATEVSELEARSDALQRAIETWVIEAGEHVAKPDQLRGLLHLAAASETICDAALDIAEIVLREGDIHPVFGQAVRESDELVTTAAVHAGSDLAERTLGELQLEENTGMAIMAVRRGDEWLLSPTGETQLRADDVLIARGPKSGAEKLHAMTAG